jgi:hypothetical protein
VEERAHPDRDRIESLLDARLAELVRTRGAMRRSSEGMRCLGCQRLFEGLHRQRTRLR